VYREIRARVHSETEEGTFLYVLIPGERLTDQLRKFADGRILDGELRIDDGRTITANQRKKAWATLGDIALWNYDDKEANHFHLKNMFMIASGEGMFSLSDCTVTTARHYISFLIEFCFEWGVPLSEPAINRTDDIDTAIFLSIKHKICICCGAGGEIHHWDAIGMGRDRRTFDDSNHRKICLCRAHHNEAHTIGREEFEARHHVYGIIYNE